MLRTNAHQQQCTNQNIVILDDKKITFARGSLTVFFSFFLMFLEEECFMHLKNITEKFANKNFVTSYVPFLNLVILPRSYYFCIFHKSKVQILTFHIFFTHFLQHLIGSIGPLNSIPLFPKIYATKFAFLKDGNIIAGVNFTNIL